MKTDATFLGSVRRVIGAKILVELSHEIPSANPIINGKVYRLGQIGSFVKIPLGLLNIYGIVSMVGASEFSDRDREIIEANSPSGQRWIEIQLIGESYRRSLFQRGITTFPTIDDEVHIVTEEEFPIIYGSLSPTMMDVGTYAASESLPAKVDIDKIITRHAAIVGSTGSGKSNTVAKLLRSIADTSFPNASVLVIDPHGEYGSALQGKARVLSIGSKENPLIIPYWALSFDELAWFLVDRRSASETMQDTILRDTITSSKKISCDKLKAGPVDENEITADSPIPFSLKEIWFNLYLNEHATLRIKDNWESVAYRKDKSGKEVKGDIEKMVPPQFEPPGAGSSPPFRSTRAVGLASYLNKILVRFKDGRFDFLINPGEYDGCKSDLHDLLASWINHEQSITVIDLGGVRLK